MYINKSEKEKRDLIVSAIHNSMFVEAGAGAGKSTLIVARIINQLKNGVKPGEIVAITFTNAATHELKDRIVKAALSEMRKPTLTEEQRVIMKAALDELDQMQISTIHSFCNRILKEKSLDAQLSVDAQLIDENELEKRRDESFVLWAEELKKSDWDILLKAGGYRKAVLERLKHLSVQFMDIPKDMEIKISLPLVDDSTFSSESHRITTLFSADFMNAINDVYTAQLNKVDDIPDDWLLKAGKECKGSFLSGDYGACLKVLFSSKGDKMIKAPTKAFFEGRLPAAGTEINGKKVLKKDIDAGAKALVSEAKEKMQSFVEDCAKHYFSANTPANNVTLILGGYENYLNEPYVSYAKDAAKFIWKRLGSDILTNNLLIQKTYDLVNSSPETRDYFAAKFKCIYVDEFQDTDHVQDAFIRLLAQDSRTGKLRPGALFVVGDPKQSIYRFRGAEPEVYFQTKAYFTGIEDAYVIELQDNYRSNQYMIEWVNAQFATKNITAGFPYVPMNASKIVDEKLLDDKAIYGIYYNKSPYAVLDGSSIDQDIDELVALIQNFIDGGYQIIDYDVQHKAYKRNITYRDFLILCMNMRDMDKYADAFRTYGIPFVMDSKVKMKNEWYLQVFVRLFDYLCDPYDRHHAEAAREGYKSLGLSYEEADYMLDKISGLVRGEVNGSVNDESGYSDDDMVIGNAKSGNTVFDSRNMSAIGILRFLEQNFLLFLSVNQVVSDTEILRIQTRITQMVERVLQACGGSTRALMDAIHLYIESEIEHELVLEDDMDAVRFMNLHKAKGLEGNIVIWTNRQESAEFKPGKYRKNGVFYPSIEAEINGFKTSVWNGTNKDETLIEEVKADYLSEKIRLEYVAATRAKQAFIIMDRYNSKETLFGSGYDFGDRSIYSIIASNQVRIAPKQPVEKEYGEMNSSFASKDGLDALAKSVFLSETPSRLEDESAGKAAVDKSVKEKYGARKRPVGAVFGTVMHRTFELLVNRIHYSAEFIKDYLGEVEAMQVMDACAIQAINESISQIPATELEDYKAFLRKMSIAFGKWWYREKMPDTIEEVYTELPFSYFAKGENADDKEGNKEADRNEQKIWWHGIADLVLKRKDGTVLIIDYKSDSDVAYPDEESFCERLRGKYSPQIDMYKQAVARSLGVSEDVISGMLVSFSQKELGKGEEIRVRVTKL